MSVTAARGFRTAGVAAGLKSSGGLDLAIVVNDGPMHSAAGVFTTNRFPAAPVLWSRQVLSAGVVRAVLLNAGGANACTGPDGFRDAHRSAEAVGAGLYVSPAEVALCSTGLIGERLPLDLLLGGVADAVAGLSADPARADDAANAIRTTDTVAKQAVATGSAFTVGGMAKGAGMLAPELATMLVVLTTDASADPATLDRVLRAATAKSFDRIDSDGCMSTNDTVLLLASGASGATPDAAELAETVARVCADLAAQLVADAEGASKEVLVEVVGAASEPEAVDVARTVARSNLLKCALHGEDANWGRVLAAVGTTTAAFEPDAVDVAINGVWVARSGAAGAPRSMVDLSGRRVTVTVNLQAGNAAAEIWTTDLTAAYVHENSAYSS